MLANNQHSSPKTILLTKQTKKELRQHQGLRQQTNRLLKEYQQFHRKLFQGQLSRQRLKICSHSALKENKSPSSQITSRQTHKVVQVIRLRPTNTLNQEASAEQKVLRTLKPLAQVALRKIRLYTPSKSSPSRHNQTRSTMLKAKDGSFYKSKTKERGFQRAERTPQRKRPKIEVFSKSIKRGGSSSQRKLDSFIAGSSYEWTQRREISLMTSTNHKRSGKTFSPIRPLNAITLC